MFRLEDQSATSCLARLMFEKDSSRLHPIQSDQTTLRLMSRPYHPANI